MTPDYNVTIKHLAKISVIALLLSTLGFYLPLSNSLSKGLVIINLSGCLIISLLIKKNKNIRSGGISIFYWFISLIILSCLPAYFYWNQSIIASLISIMSFLLYGLFIILIRDNIPKIFIHKLLLIVGIISLFLFYLKVMMPSIPIGRISDDPERGFRFNVPGLVYTSYLYFYALKKCVNHFCKKNIKYFIIILLYCGILLLQKGRSQMAVIAILSLIYYIKVNKMTLYKYTVMVIVVIGIATFNYTSIRELVNLTNKQMDSSNPDQHVREIGMYYYFFEFPIKGINFLIGNGVPSYGRSKYGEDAEAFAEETKIHLVDIGWVGIYNYWGLLGLGLYISIFYYFIFRTSSLHYRHTKYFLGSLFGQSIVSAVPLYLQTIAAIGFGCYLLSNEKSIILKKKN